MPVLTVAFLSAIVAAPPTTLPLRRLRLYETGVGYFERRGSVAPGRRARATGERERGTSPEGALALPLPSSHLDDALKSLVVLEATGGVRIQGVEWGSSVSEGMARAMAGLPTEDAAPLSYDDLLASLKGSRVQLSTGDGKIRGRLVDIEGPFYLEARPRPADADAEATEAPRGEPHYTLIVLDEDDAVRRIKTDRVQAIGVLDEDTAARLDVAATALSHQTARQSSKLEVQVSAPGRLGLGYVSEAPVWRTTYRVVMGTDPGEGQLQAWALVHNDTDEDWREVAIELANGRPTSFLHPLAAPRYSARELLAPPEALATVPQLANQTADSMWGDGIGDSYAMGGLGLSGTGGGGGGEGEGTMGMGNIGVIGHGGGAGMGGGEALGDLAELAQADGSESGALFLYRVADPVDLRAHHSALVPIVQQPIEVESITFFGLGSADGVSAARIVNTTTQTLPPGVVSFFADGGFVGESVLDRLKPKERRFTAYGSELDVTLERSREALGEQVSRLQWDAERITIWERYVLESEIHLQLDNRSGRARRVYVALDVPRNAELHGGEGLDLDFDLATDTPLCAAWVEPGAADEHVLRVKSNEVRGHTELDAAHLEALRERPGVSAEQRAALDEAIGHVRRQHERLAAAARDEAAVTELQDDLVRLREDLAAIGKARARSRARNALTRDLLDKEARIGELRAQATALRDEADAAGRAMILALAGLESPRAKARAR